MKEKTSSQVCSMGLALVAAAAISCGGSGGGSTSAAAGNATLSGNVTQTSAAALHAAAPTLLARVFRLLSPVTDAIAASSGIRVLVHSLSASTDQNGSFVINGAGAGLSTVTFEQNGQTFTLQVTVPDGSTVVLRDIALGADGEARPGQIDTYLRGTIGGASCATTPETLTVALTNQSVTVDLDANTRIKGTDSAPVSTCDDLANAVGQNVRVEAITQSDGTLLAERVKVGSGGAIDPANEIGFRGTVSATSCPTSFTLERGDGSSVTVNLTGTTELEDGATCESLSGEHVKVRGTLETDGSVTASEVEIETDGEESCEGRRSFQGPGGGEHEPTETPTPTATPTPTEVPAA
jgi:hypothetical protein